MGLGNSGCFILRSLMNKICNHQLSRPRTQKADFEADGHNPNLDSLLL